jgi:3-deoxy-manno-octulosonate cytidylyltransferase (CMP-KDO synthetase)
MNIGIIPARLNSTRLSEKILIPIGGIPMVVQVYRQVLKTKKLDKVIVAVDDEKTQVELKKFGVSGIMTSDFHQSGTDRIAEVLKDEDTDIVVNIQADEPEIEPELIDDLVFLFEDSDTEMGTAVTSDLTIEDLENPDVVKVKIDEKGMAINFSRQPITGNSVFRHIGIYAFKTYVLEKFIQLPISNREKERKLEQMRALDNGIPIRTIITDYKGRGVDNIGDVKRLEMQYGP